MIVTQLSPPRQVWQQTGASMAVSKETERKAFKRFQREDLPRAALHDGCILAWDTGLGKALPKHALVMTPRGYRIMGSLRVGDEVTGSNGRPTKITGVFPQGFRDSYKVTFTDGTIACCDLDHLWAVRTKVGKFKGRGFKPRTLRAMLASGLRFQEGCRFFIPIVAPIQFKSEGRPTIDPYLLGLLLGDGGMSRDGDSPTISSADEEILNSVRRLLPADNELVHAGAYDYRIKGTKWHRNPLLTALRDLKLMGCGSGTKFIPSQYLRGSVKDREAILQGLLDTDGCVRAKDSNIEYCTTSKRLAHDVRFIVQSLGGTAEIRTKQPQCQTGAVCALAYRLSVILPDTVTPFRLSRKAALYRPRSKYKPTRGIVSAEPCGQASMICISVDALDRCYVIEHCVVTHNTWATFIWPLLKAGFKRENGFNPEAPVLIVAPEHLHEQTEDEARDQFGIKLIRLESQDNYLKILAVNNGTLPAAWYIVSFTQLASNKVIKVPDTAALYEESKLKFYAEFLHMNIRKILADPMFIQNPLGNGQRPASDVEKLRAALSTKVEQATDGLGKEFHGIRCVFSPSLAELCRNDFKCVVIDEATKIKGEDTDVGLGVRLMNPKYRLVLTATPIKNRLPDLFWLAWWASGGKPEAHARWPYSKEQGEQDKFAQEFLVAERNLSAEARQNKGKPLSDNVRGGKRRRGKVTAEVCNIHRLWKLIGPVILRRRKMDVGEDLVEKIRQPIRVPMGEQQALVYGYHLEADYKDKHGKPAIGAKLQALRSAAAAPHSALLRRVSYNIIPLPEDNSPPTEKEMYRSDYEYIPKVAACLTVIENIIRRGEQGVVFSAFHEPLDTVARRLDDAGIPYEQLDGRDSQKHRGSIAALFKKGRPKAKPILLAGINAMAEGHSWHLANNCILLAFDWAYNLFEQGINRVHRLNSKKTVNVYPIICAGTIDRKLEALIEEKGNACELVLDGRLMGENVEEVNLAELLQIAAAEFAEQQTYSEELLEKEWPALKARLQSAYSATRYVGVTNGGIQRINADPIKMPFATGGEIPVIHLSRPEVREVMADLARGLHAPLRTALTPARPRVTKGFW